jgi:hypothetical protein
MRLPDVRQQSSRRIPSPAERHKQRLRGRRRARFLAAQGREDNARATVALAARMADYYSPASVKVLTILYATVRPLFELKRGHEPPVSGLRVTN